MVSNKAGRNPIRMGRPIKVEATETPSLQTQKMSGVFAALDKMAVSGRRQLGRIPNRFFKKLLHLFRQNGVKYASYAYPLLAFFHAEGEIQLNPGFQVMPTNEPSYCFITAFEPFI